MRSPGPQRRGSICSKKRSRNSWRGGWGLRAGGQGGVPPGRGRGPEIFLHIFRVRRAGEHGRDHEGRVDDLAEAELLEEVVRAAEERRRRRLAVDQVLHAAEEDALGEGELDVLRVHVLLERLDGGVV